MMKCHIRKLNGLKTFMLFLLLLFKLKKIKWSDLKN